MAKKQTLSKMVQYEKLNFEASLRKACEKFRDRTGIKKFVIRAESSENNVGFKASVSTEVKMEIYL